MTTLHVVPAEFDHRFTENEDRATGRMCWRSIEVWQSDDSAGTTRFFAQAPGITATSEKSYEDALSKLRDRAARVLNDLATRVPRGGARQEPDLPDPEQA